MFPVGSVSSTRSAANPALVASAPRARAANTVRPVRPVRRVVLRGASGEPFANRRILQSWTRLTREKPVGTAMYLIPLEHGKSGDVSGTAGSLARIMHNRPRIMHN
jgi:hypothetical protein